MPTKPFFEIQDDEYKLQEENDQHQGKILAVNFWKVATFFKLAKIWYSTKELL